MHEWNVNGLIHVAQHTIRACVSSVIVPHSHNCILSLPGSHLPMPPPEADMKGGSSTETKTYTQTTAQTAKAAAPCNCPTGIPAEQQARLGAG